MIVATVPPARVGFLSSIKMLDDRPYTGLARRRPQQTAPQTVCAVRTARFEPPADSTKSSQTRRGRVEPPAAGFPPALASETTTTGHRLRVRRPARAFTRLCIVEFMASRDVVQTFFPTLILSLGGRHVDPAAGPLPVLDESSQAGLSRPCRPFARSVTKLGASFRPNENRALPFTPRRSFVFVVVVISCFRVAYLFFIAALSMIRDAESR